MCTARNTVTSITNRGRGEHRLPAALLLMGSCLPASLQYLDKEGLERTEASENWSRERSFITLGNQICSWCKEKEGESHLLVHFSHFFVSMWLSSRCYVTDLGSRKFTFDLEILNGQEFEGWKRTRCTRDFFPWMVALTWSSSCQIVQYRKRRPHLVSVKYYARNNTIKNN